MPSINMIAARRAEAKRLEARTRTVLLVLIAEVALLLGTLSFMTARVYSASRTIGKLNQELQVIQPTVDKINEYEAQIEKLKPRLDLLTGSRDQTAFWCAVLKNLSKSMPEETWLSNVSTNMAAGSQDQKDMALNVRGTSVSQRLVGETMLRFNQFGQFKRVDLTYTQKGQDMAKPTIDFEIALMLANLDSQKGGTESNVSN